MRVMIKNEANGVHETNGTNGTHPAPGTNGADGADGTGAHASGDGESTKPFEQALRSSALLRMVNASAGDIRESLLQILSGTKPYLPKLHVRETPEAIDVTATLPGVDQSSVEVAFEGRLLRVSGMKTRLREQLRRKYRRMQKVYRTFDRKIPIYCDVDRDKAVATLRNDILRIHVPKSEASRGVVEPVHVTTESTPFS